RPPPDTWTSGREQPVELREGALPAGPRHLDEARVVRALPDDEPRPALAGVVELEPDAHHDAVREPGDSLDALLAHQQLVLDHLREGGIDRRALLGVRVGHHHEPLMAP